MPKQLKPEIDEAGNRSSLEASTPKLVQAGNLTSVRLSQSNGSGPITHNLDSGYNVDRVFWSVMLKRNRSNLFLQK